MKFNYIPFFMLMVMSSFAQQKHFNFVIVAEVGTTECSVKENVFFTTSVIKTTFNNPIDRHEFLEEVHADYIVFLEELVKNKYPEYNKDCILVIERWKFYDEWAFVNIERLKEHVNRKYQFGKIIATKYNWTPNPPIAVIEKKEIDPNLALIDAYFTQAEKEYNTKNFKKSLSVLDKAKGLLAGKKNLNIMLLEAKSKMIIDKNINETKTLLNEFVKEAAKQNDKRLNEGANLLVSLETSNDYYDTGFKKEYQYTTNTDTDVLTCVDKLDKNGKVLFSKQLSSIWNDSIFKEIDNSINNEQKIVYYTQNGSIKKREYYRDGLPKLFTYTKQNRADYYNQGNLVQSVVYNGDKSNITVFNSSGKTIFTISDVSILNKTPLNLNSAEEIKSSNLGIVLEVKEILDIKAFNTYTFYSSGMPKEKYYYKKEGKLKDTYAFNSSSLTWNEVK